MDIYFKNTDATPGLAIDVNDDSYRYQAIKGEHNLTLHFSLAQHVEVPVGAWCMFEAERYELEMPSNFKKKTPRNFEYTLIMESVAAKAKKYKFRNPVDRRLMFSLTAKPREHLQMFIDNMNLRESGWSIGECIDAPEKLISYNHAFCIDALTQQADEFETEYEFIGKKVSLRKLEYNKSNPLPLAFGKGNGFKPGVGRANYDDTKPIEVLYVQGGEENIDASKYGSKELLLPKNATLRYDGAHFEGEIGFDMTKARTYVSDADGFSLHRGDKQLVTGAENSLGCSHIYPKRVGGISKVEVVNAAKNFYDFIDSTIPADLNYNDCLIAGETMTVIFQSGMLAGKEFEVKYYHEAKTVKGVAKAARRFEIVPQEIDGVTMPNDAFKPAAEQDTYAVFNISLPTAYVCDNATKSGASWEMFRESIKYLYENEGQKFTFTGELDGAWAKRDWLNIGGKIRLGGYILFSDTQFQQEGVAIRIVGIKDFINKPHSPEIELSNQVIGSSFTSTLGKIEENEVVVEDNHKEAIQFTKRRYRDLKETTKMIEGALLNFSDSINPITVSTMQILLGDESLQFRFVNSKTNPANVRHDIVFSDQTKQLTADAGILQHLTLGIKSLSSSHAASEYLFWTLPEFVSAVLDEPSVAYYLYAKVSKVAQTGTFMLSEDAIPMDGADDYYLLCGALNSEFEGSRSFVQLYGYTEMLPGRMTIDKIVSPDGQSYFDLANRAFRIGDNRTSFEYNINGDGKLRQRGAVVVSPAGAESPLPCWRGDWDSSALYYAGDEVGYVGASYRCRVTCPASGIMPINPNYWEVVAKGSKGDAGSKGDRFGQVYMWTGEAQSPSKPVGRTLAAVAAEGWVESNARRRVIVNKATGRPLARRMADGTVRVLTAGLPKHYRLYVVSGELTADGGELVGEWSEPLLCVEQSVIDGLNSDIDTADKKATDAKTTAEQAKLEAERAKVTADNITTTVKKSFTEIEGGMVLTQMLQTRNNEGEVTAGISGVNEYEGRSKLPAFWAGGTYPAAVGGTAPIIFRHNGQGKIGMCEINERGSLRMLAQDGSKQYSLLITNEKIIDVASGDDSRTTNNALFSDTARQSVFRRVKRLPNSIAVTKGPVNLKIAATLACESAGRRMIADFPDSMASSFAQLYLCTTGSRVLLGRIGTSPDYRLLRDSLAIDTSIEVASGNTYWLELDYGGAIEVADAGHWQASVSASSMSWSYVDENDDSNIQICSNGIGVSRSSAQQFQSKIDPATGNCVTTMAGQNKLSGNTKITGSLDAPGVLRAGRVNAGGSIVGTSWGAKPCSCIRPNSATGQYKITHNIGHTDYFITANLADSGFAGMVTILDKQPSYALLGVRGLDGQLYNVAFEFMICGRN